MNASRPIGVAVLVLLASLAQALGSLTATFNAATDVPVTSDGYAASGNLNVTLGFSPAPGQVLTLVDNTTGSSIAGSFTGLAEGALVSMGYAGNVFHFIISYSGGDGNNVTLTRTAGPGQVGTGTDYAWTNFAGLPGGGGNRDGIGYLARFSSPQGVATDSNGNVYVADGNNNTIRKISNTGVVTTLAGAAGSYGSTDGTGNAARFYCPSGVAVDNSGNVYVTDTTNHTIRKITGEGVVTTLAGIAGSSGSTDGPGNAAKFSFPQGIAVDSGGNLYVVSNCTIRKITSSGEVTTLAGVPGSSGSTDGTGNEAKFNYPSGVAVDINGNLYVTDTYNNTIRKITSNGEVTTLAGAAGVFGRADGTGNAAMFFNPRGVAVDSSGNLYVTDYNNNTIRKITSTGVVTTWAGTAPFPGATDGTGSAARFNYPWGVTVDSSDTVYVADGGNNVIRKITSSGEVTTFAGSSGSPGSSDGVGVVARFCAPKGVGIDSSGNVFVADTPNHTIRKITSSGEVTTVAGVAGVYGSTDGTGTNARFNQPTGVALDNSGNVYVADTWNNKIRKITSSGEVTTFAGAGGGWGSNDGSGSSAKFNQPTGVAVDSDGNVYVADGGNHTIRKVSNAGVVTTFAGLAGSSGSTDGTGNAARFNRPTGIAVDKNGNLFVVDTSNFTIRKITGAGVVTTMAGLKGSSGSADGTGSSARFYFSSGVAVDGSGSLYVADTNNFTIRKITTNGVVSTIGGTAWSGGDESGTGSAAKFWNPFGVAVNNNGSLYVADSGNNRISRGLPLEFKPLLKQGDVSALGSTSCTLNGTVNANGFVCTAQFEYGTTENYGSTASVALSPNNGTDAQSVSAILSGLTPSTGYFYRLTAANVDGIQSTTGGYFLTASNNTNLSDIILSSDTLPGVSLSPVFASGTTNYMANVQNLMNSVTVTVVMDDWLWQARTVRVNGIEVSWGWWGSSGSVEIPLEIGNNVINVVVTAPDGTTTKTYTVTVTRAASSVFNAATDVPMISFGYTASGNFGVTLGFLPVLGQVLTLVNNMSDSSIVGTFTGLPEGASVTANYLGDTLHFIVSYVGGDGNDITLTRTAGPGQVPSGSIYSWRNFAGLPSTGCVDGTASEARFERPYGVAVDGSGNVYVADTANCVIRKITSSGVVTTLAGMAGFTGSTDGIGSLARFFKPSGVALDSAGNIYVADASNQTIRKITPAGEVTTLAGSARSIGSADGTGSVARFRNPSGVAVDNNGTIYVADTDNDTIRKITGNGEVTTLAGLAVSPGSTDGAGSLSRFRQPGSVAVDSSGNVFVADTGNNTIRKVTSDGVVTTVAGRGLDVLNSPSGVAVDGSGNLFVADKGFHAIRKITNVGAVTVLAGAMGSSGSSDGTGTAARFNSPMGTAVDGSGNVYVADTSNSTIRKVTSSGVVTTLAGPPESSGGTDGAGSVARFFCPSGIAVDHSGDLVVADQSNNTIRRITNTGVVTTLAGMVGSSGKADGTGNTARFSAPSGVAGDEGGNVFVADWGNSTIRKITSSGEVTTLAGLAGDIGSTDGIGSAAKFNFPYGVVVDGSGNVYVSDSANHTIRKIKPDGTVSTWAGKAGESGSTDGVGSAARFYFPRGLALDTDGNLYVADLFNYTIRKITNSGVVTTMAGKPGAFGITDGTGDSARFLNPNGVAVDSNGNVYVAEINHVIRKVTPSSEVTTIGGTWQSGSSDGVGSAAKFNGLYGVAVNLSGDLFVADYFNNRISRGLRVDCFRPFLTQRGITGIGSACATVNGSVNPNGFVATAQIEYGPTSNYGSTVSVTLSPDNGTSVQDVSAALSGLSPATTYYYRLSATNADGTQSATGSFTTLTLVENWRQTHFPGSTQTTGPGADTAAPLADGIPNLIKFATGMDPTRPGRMPGTTGTDPDNITFTYTPSAEAVAAGVTFTVEYTDTLDAASWKSDIVDQGNIAMSGIPVTAVVPRGVTGRRFLHLRVTSP